VKPKEISKPVILFLQGPLSSFYSEIASYLIDENIEVHKINLCGNDVADWHHESTFNYTGTLDNWIEYLDDTAKKLGITHILMHADRRPYHKIAVEWAKQNSVEVYVTELGYLRPDWITIEPWGTSSFSQFTREPKVIHEMAKEQPDFNLAQKYQDSVIPIIAQEARWTFFNLLYKWKFPNFQTHRSESPWHVYPGWIISKLRGFVTKTIKPINTFYKSPYFVMALQLEGDFQLRDHSPFDSMAEGIEHVVQSFAVHAPKEATLVLKLHPHESNRYNLIKKISQIANLHNLTNRISTIENIPITKLCEKASGFITINSSAGFEALAARCPSYTICKTIYSIEGLTFQGTIDDFWKQKTQPDMTLLNDLRKALYYSIQVRGTLYNKNGRNDAALAIARKLTYLSQ